MTWVLIGFCIACTITMIVCTYLISINYKIGVDLVMKWSQTGVPISVYMTSNEHAPLHTKISVDTENFEQAMAYAGKHIGDASPTAARASLANHLHQQMEEASARGHDWLEHQRQQVRQGHLQMPGHPPNATFEQPVPPKNHVDQDPRHPPYQITHTPIIDPRAYRTNGMSQHDLNVQIQRSLQANMAGATHAHTYPDPRTYITPELAGATIMPPIPGTMIINPHRNPAEAPPAPGSYSEQARAAMAQANPAGTPPLPGMEAKSTTPPAVEVAPTPEPASPSQPVPTESPSTNQ